MNAHGNAMAVPLQRHEVPRDYHGTPCYDRHDSVVNARGRVLAVSRHGMCQSHANVLEGIAKLLCVFPESMGFPMSSR